jgi:hypothetical protein
MDADHSPAREGERHEAAIAAVIAEERSFVEAMTDAVVAEVPSLKEVPRERLEYALTTDFRRALTAVMENRRATEEDVAERADKAAVFAQEGISLETVLDAYRISTRRAWELALEHAERFGLEPDIMLDRAGAMWAWSDDMMVRTAEAYRAIEARFARQDREQRDACIRRILQGTANDSDLRERAPSYGLRPGTLYRAFRARVERADDVARLRRAVAASAAAGGRQPVITTLDGDLAGLTPGLPSEIDVEAVVAFGQPAELETVSTSFLLASRVLETALTLDLKGVARAEDLSLRLAVGSEAALGDLLVDRYLSPLRPLEEYGEVLEASVREYLNHDLKVGPAARELQVHPNSLRYRLRRFQELTETDLDRVQHLLEVWWALERRSLTGNARAE